MLQPVLISFVAEHRDLAARVATRSVNSTIVLLNHPRTTKLSETHTSSPVALRKRT